MHPKSVCEYYRTDSRNLGRPWEIREPSTHKAKDLKVTSQPSADEMLI